MPALIIAAADAILSDIESRLGASGRAYKKLDLNEKLGIFLTTAADNLAAKLGTKFETLRPHITDFISFGPSIYEPHHTMDVVKRADVLQLGHAELHTIDLGGASAPATLELARRIVQDEGRLVLIAGSEVPRGGPGGVQYYREVSDALLNKTTELHTQANLISLYALLADRMMFEHEISQQHIDAITTFYRNQAVQNERASVFQKPLKIGELAKFLVGPYATAMVAVATDHAAAFLVGSEKSLARLTQEAMAPSQPTLCIRGVGTHHAPKYLTDRRDFTSPAAIAGRRAFERAGLTQSDVDYAWIYDCFTLMLVRQAADYFGLEPHAVAESLTKGFINISGREIRVNQQGGILNTQAAISLSATTGLLDIIEYAQQNAAAKHFFFGGNGGIDCVNSVALLSREYAESAGSYLPSPQQTPVTPQPLAEGETATIYAAVMVRFNPGADVPFCLATLRRKDGSLALARICDLNGNGLKERPAFVHDETQVRIQLVDSIPVAIILPNR